MVLQKLVRLASWFFVLQLVLGQTATDNLKYVNQLIGSANGGNVFAGATLPYGMAKAVADVDSESNQGGFTTEGGNVTGFSTMHDSGTGGSPSLGNFAIFPHASCAGGDVNGCVFPKQERKVHYYPDSVIASPGYFRLYLESGVLADMTTAQHTSLFRFSFPDEGDESPLLLLDLTDLSNSRQDNASITIDPATGRMEGNARFKPSFGIDTYVAYFCADFKGAEVRDNGIFVNSRANSSVKELKINRGTNNGPLPGGGFIRFTKNPDDGILARIAVSYISSEQACSNAEKEIPDFDFRATRQAAEEAWREKLDLITVSTEGVKTSLITNFYSGIYRTMVNPQNYTGENPNWESSEPYFDSFYCLWDSFRSQLPFLLINDPLALNDMVRSLIDTAKYEGWLPDCHMSLCKGLTQGGSNADVVLADFFVKSRDTSTGINWETAYEYMLRDAEQEPFFWSVQGRGGLDSWAALGYIPTQDFDYKGFGTMTRSVSRTLEYAYNDFCIAQMALGLDKDSGVVEKYKESSNNWKNLFKKDQTSFFVNGSDTGFVGFFQGRYLNGTWHDQDPLLCSAIDNYSNKSCSLQNTGQETFESSLWEYGFFVPGDQAALIQTYGGPEAFVKRLDFLHDQSITYIGNEPSFLTVFQYHYAGRPALSAERSHFYIPRYFSPTNAGLPGNDDSGAMGSFVAMSMMGLFPNPGQDVYLITPPYFASVSIKSPLTGKTATIRNVNFDPTYDAIYIQSATLDGEPYTKNWIGHDFFTEERELVLTLGKNESSWGTRVEDLPPSLSEYIRGNGTGSENLGRRRMSMGMLKERAGLGSVEMVGVGA
ncbi:alpha-1,2-mannosidase family protein [Bimuria novae-zelandiae CBS 107.79]|uniref:Alpha-1,2-mannosidase family protein n=1 Tax=Bimuria novae-zelandiae CBS 107.79 TaxID=1447943 RepID=A0A6A5UGJ4_9PLEO|nr:alpha-1,2-mannosidase family protein [Bimuria novae-zelandiae CBS 107.79]